jgi:KDO2-lipid IV(A) lauroyltransferase
MSSPSSDAQVRRRAALLIGTLSRLPLPVLYGVSYLLYLLLFHLFRFQRRLLIGNLGRVFPDKKPAEIRRLAAASYRNALDFLFETVKAWRFDEHDFQRRVEIENPQLLTGLLQQHKVVVALTSHCGNWEWLQLACSAQLDSPIAAVYKPLNHRGIDALLLDLRTRFGSTLIDSKNVLPELVKFARKGGIIALNADQSPRPEDEKQWANFLGIETAFFTGPEKLARLFRAPVVYVHMRRLRRGRFLIRFETLAEPPYQVVEGDVMRPYVRAVEAQIRSAPQDWFWLYKRWKYKKPLYH